MKKITKLMSVIIFLATVAVFNIGCKKSFDQPPGPTDLNIVPNSTIDALKSYHTVSGNYDLINEDVIISGIVVANDKGGNIYKQLFIQDETGAIQLLVDGFSLYNSFPVGRRVYVKCKGLTLSDANGTMVLGVKATINGASSMEGITSATLSKYLLGGSLNNTVEPLKVNVVDLGTNLSNRYINALIQLEGYEFIPADTSKIYSDTSAFKSTQNRQIQDCNSTIKTTVRTSAYASFAGVKIPKGNGTITAIYTIFKSSPTGTATKQLIIRNTDDVQFNGDRCDGGTPPPPPPPNGKVLLDENFETQTANTTAPYSPISITGWNNLAEVGTRAFDARIFSNNKYAYLSAFGSKADVITTWLVTKGISMDATTSEILTFDTKQDFFLSSYTPTPGIPVPSTLKVFVSTNYSGTGNPWAAGVNWTDLSAKATFSPGSTTSAFPSAFTPSGSVDLSSYTGTIYIAFKYEGADPSAGVKKTSAWEIDNVRVIGQ